MSSLHMRLVGFEFIILLIHMISNTSTGMQHIWEKSTYRLLVGKFEGKRTVRKSEVDGKKILKWILEK
jgi:hypothetical protein